MKKLTASLIVALGLSVLATEPAEAGYVGGHHISCPTGTTEVRTYGECCGCKKAKEVKVCRDSAGNDGYYWGDCVHDADSCTANCPPEGEPTPTPNCSNLNQIISSCIRVDCDGAQCVKVEKWCNSQGYAYEKPGQTIGVACTSSAQCPSCGYQPPTPTPIATPSPGAPTPSPTPVPPGGVQCPGGANVGDTSPGPCGGNYGNSCPSGTTCMCVCQSDGFWHVAAASHQTGYLSCCGGGGQAGPSPTPTPTPTPSNVPGMPTPTPEKPAPGTTATLTPAPACQTGDKRCDPNNSQNLQHCDSLGQWIFIQQCPMGTVCKDYGNNNLKCEETPDNQIPPPQPGSVPLGEECQKDADCQNAGGDCAQEGEVRCMDPSLGLLRQYSNLAQAEKNFSNNVLGEMTSRNLCIKAFCQAEECDRIPHCEDCGIIRRHCKPNLAEFHTRLGYTICCPPDMILIEECVAYCEDYRNDTSNLSGEVKGTGSDGEVEGVRSWRPVPVVLAAEELNLVGAQVVLVDASGKKFATETDENGSFSVDVPTGQTYMVTVRAPAYKQLTFSLTPAGGRDYFNRIKLEKTASEKEGNFEIEEVKGDWLYAGWNLISLAVEPVKPLRASELVVEINGQGGAAVAVARWQDSRWQTHLSGVEKNDFLIEVGEAYFVENLRETRFGLEGEVITQPEPLDLKPGWNAVGLPQLSGVSVLSGSAQGILNQVDGQKTGVARAMSRFESGLWEAVAKQQDEFFGQNFLVQPGVGYFLKVSQLLQFQP